MKSRCALILFFVAIGVYGAITGYYGSFNAEPPKPLDLSFTVMTVALLYLWYYFDAAEQNYKRTVLLGGAVVMFSILAIPYYLVRSRPKGAKAKAFIRFLGLLVLTLLIGILAGLPFALLQRGG